MTSSIIVIIQDLLKNYQHKCQQFLANFNYDLTILPYFFLPIELIDFSVLFPNHFAMELSILVHSAMLLSYFACFAKRFIILLTESLGDKQG
jgi:hypothetical protein